MSQIIWMISLIPDSVLIWIIDIMILAGITGIIAGWLGRWIPFYGTYAKFLKPLGIVLLVFGIYCRGGYDTEMAWRDKVTKLEEQVKESEAKSKETNTVIQKVYVDRVKKVKEVQVVIRERIKEVEKRIDAECKVAPEAVSILNDAARLRKGTVEISPMIPEVPKK